MFFWVVAGVFSFVGVLTLIGGFNKLFRIKVVSGFFRTLIGLAFTAIGIGVGLIGLNFQQYERLIHEQDVAEISFKQKDEQRFEAQLKIGEETGIFDLAGDEWRMDAHVLKFKPWANVVGLDAHYKLDRLEGRYTHIDDEKNKSRTVHALSDDPGLDVQELIRSHHAEKLKIDKWIDARYGSGVFVPMIDEGVFTVTIAQSGGLIARPSNTQAKQAVDGWNESSSNDGEVE